jgi:hypothetical protein
VIAGAVRMRESVSISTDVAEVSLVTKERRSLFHATVDESLETVNVLPCALAAFWYPDMSDMQPPRVAVIIESNAARAPPRKEKEIMMKKCCE